MKFYTQNRSISPKARAVLLRILFVILAAAVITFGTIILGQYLLRKVEAAGAPPADLSGTGWQPEKSGMDPEYTAGSAPQIRACGISLSEYPTVDLLTPVFQEIAASYDTVLYPLSGSDGSLIYQSPAVCALTRIPITDEESGSRIREAILAARNNGFRVIVSLFPSEAVTDAALFSELASWGANEILIVPNFSGTIDYETANRLRLYLNECSSSLDSACRLGTVLPAACYLDSSGTMQLQMIAQSSSTLGIRFDVQYMDPEADVYENVYNALQSLLGSFSVYNMRVFIDGTPAAVEAQYRACADRGIMNFIFASKTDYNAFEQPPVEEEPEEVPETTVYRPEQPAGIINPYATVGDTYENGDRDGTTRDDSTWNNDSWTWTDNTSYEDDTWYDENDWDSGENTWDNGNDWDSGENTWDSGNDWDSGENTWDNGSDWDSGENTWDSGNDWDSGENTWDNGNNWDSGENTWDNGNDWNAGENTWDNENTWNAGENTWDNGNTWDAGQNTWDSGNDWNSGENTSYDEEDWYAWDSSWDDGSQWVIDDNSWGSGSDAGSDDWWSNPDDSWTSWDGNG